MGFKRFEDIIAWQKSRELTKEIYKRFKSCHDYGFRDQVQRAAVSVMNNIAEGFERAGDKTFKQFLFIAKGSSGEVRSMVYLAKDLGYISKEEHDQFTDQALEISRLLSGLIKSLRT